MPLRNKYFKNLLYINPEPGGKTDGCYEEKKQGYNE